jgi:hypothetical protein
MTAYPIFPQPGDIALIGAHGKPGAFNVSGQRALRTLLRHPVLKRPRKGSPAAQTLTQNYSHVLLNFSSELWCDAMPGRGVTLRTLEETPLANPEGDYRIFRPPEKPVAAVKGANALERVQATFSQIDREIAERKSWMDAVVFYLGQKYNYRVHLTKFPKRDVTKFCSELVAGVFKVRQIAPFEKVTPAHILPNDIEALLTRAIGEGSGWTDITAGVAAFLLFDKKSSSSSVLTADDSRRMYLSGLENSTRLKLHAVEWTIIDLKKAVLLYSNALKSAHQGLIASERRQAVAALTAALKVQDEIRSLDTFFHKAAPYMMGESFMREVRATKRKLERWIRDLHRLLNRHRK